MKAIIDFDKTDSSYIQLIRNEADYIALEKSTRHWVHTPSQYPAIYSGQWWDNPNGPYDIDWTETASGDCITIVEDDE